MISRFPNGWYWFNETDIPACGGVRVHNGLIVEGAPRLMGSYKHAPASVMENYDYKKIKD